MTDDILKKFYEKHLKEWFKRNYKFLLVILLYVLYQSNFLISLVNAFGLNIHKLSKTARIAILIINDFVYVCSILLLFIKEIKNGLKDLKNNFTDRVLLSVNCWIIGCLIMTISSLLISAISGQNLSSNEAIVRKSISIAPFYMLFTCSIVAPVLEEMVFRRSLYGIINNKKIFIIISGVSFGLLHILGNYNSITDLLYIIPYGSMGFAFAYLLTKTQNITLPIMIHMIHNFILVIIQILGR